MPFAVQSIVVLHLQQPVGLQVLEAQQHSLQLRVIDRYLTWLALYAPLPRGHNIISIPLVILSMYSAVAGKLCLCSADTVGYQLQALDCLAGIAVDMCSIALLSVQILDQVLFANRGGRKLQQTTGSERASNTLRSQLATADAIQRAVNSGGRQGSTANAAGVGSTTVFANAQGNGQVCTLPHCV